MIQRRIVSIDDAKCDGCGQCVPSCHEGAIRIVNGKARLVSDVYCDGLGACLGHCPRDAISVIERAALPFDEAAVAARLRGEGQPSPIDHVPPRGCPGTAVRQLLPAVVPRAELAESPHSGTSDVAGREVPVPRLTNWPIQLRLVPPDAAFLRGADLLLVADCVPFAHADFHGRFLDGRCLLVGCPKLDDGQFYVQKLAHIVRTAGLRSVTVLHMEVPCCLGLVQIAQAAVRMAGVELVLRETTISVRGEELGTRFVGEGAAPASGFRV